MRINEQHREMLNLLSQCSIVERAKRMKRLRSADLSKTVEDTLREYPVFKALQEIKSAGGLNYALLRKDYGKDQARDLMRRRPGIVSKTGKAKLDEIAQDNGFQDGDLLLNTIIETKPKKTIIKDIRDKMVKHQEEMEWRVRGFEPTDGIYPESLCPGDQVYMGGEYYVVCGYGEDGLLILASQGVRIKVNPDNKLPCDGIKRKD